MKPAEWLTVSQAAAVLGISERQSRRYAKRLSADDRQEPDTDSGHTSGARPALVRLQAMQAARKRATGQKTAQIGTTETADTTPDTRPASAGQTPDTMTGHTTGPALDGAPLLLVEKDARIADLQKQVEFLQARNAELNAILMRHAHSLPATAQPMPLEAPTSDGSTAGAQVPQPPIKNAQRPAAARLTPLQRLVARLVGIRLRE